MSKQYWPDRIGRLEHVDELVTIVVEYHDPLTDERYRAGCERGGRRGRRGWWVHRVDESVRSDGYRDFDPSSKDDAIRQLRSLASATVGVGDWSHVEISVGDQAELGAWEGRPPASSSGGA